MCLALPARVLERLDDERITIDLGGVRKIISAALTPEAQAGDYVIVHVGYAIGVIDADEAERTLALFAGVDLTRLAEDSRATAPTPATGATS